MRTASPVGMRGDGLVALLASMERPMDLEAAGVLEFSSVHPRFSDREKPDLEFAAVRKRVECATMDGGSHDPQQAPGHATH